jgi:hypothetical protein
MVCYSPVFYLLVQVILLSMLATLAKTHHPLKPVLPSKELSPVSHKRRSGYVHILFHERCRHGATPSLHRNAIRITAPATFLLWDALSTSLGDHDNFEVLSIWPVAAASLRAPISFSLVYQSRKGSICFGNLTGAHDSMLSLKVDSQVRVVVSHTKERCLAGSHRTIQARIYWRAVRGSSC